MPSKTTSALLITTLFWIASLFIWPGCYSLERSSHLPLRARNDTNFLRSNVNQLSRSEVIAKLGEPDFYSRELNVAGYKVNAINHRTVTMFLVIPIMVQHYPDGQDVALIEFDVQGRVVRSVVKEMHRPLSRDPWSDEARDWVSHPAITKP